MKISEEAALKGASSDARRPAGRWEHSQMQVFVMCGAGGGKCLLTMKGANVNNV